MDLIASPPPVPPPTEIIPAIVRGEVGVGVVGVSDRWINLASWWFLELRAILRDDQQVDRNLPSFAVNRQLEPVFQNHLKHLRSRDPLLVWAKFA
jgi:aminoglycoside phosphotransferase